MSYKKSKNEEHEMLTRGDVVGLPAQCIFLDRVFEGIITEVRNSSIGLQLHNGAVVKVEPSKVRLVEVKDVRNKKKEDVPL